MQPLCVRALPPPQCLIFTLFLPTLLPTLWPVAGVTEAYEDAANCLWLLSNAKPCANCKSPIQKNEGCNHMQCAKVGSLTVTYHRTKLLLSYVDRHNCLSVCLVLDRFIILAAPSNV